MATAIVLAAATLCGLACHARVPDFLSTNGFCIFRTTFHHTSISLVEDFMFHKFVWGESTTENGTTTYELQPTASIVLRCCQIALLKGPATGSAPTGI